MSVQSRWLSYSDNKTWIIPCPLGFASPAYTRTKYRALISAAMSPRYINLPLYKQSPPTALGKDENLIFYTKWVILGLFQHEDK
jgi:hypothetical protein